METTRHNKSLDTIQIIFHLLFSLTGLLLAILSSCGFFWTVRDLFTGCLLIPASISVYSLIRLYSTGFKTFSPQVVVDLLPCIYVYSTRRYAFSLFTLIANFISINVYLYRTTIDYPSAFLGVFFLSVLIIESVSKLFLITLLGE